MARVIHAWLEEHGCGSRACQALVWYPGSGDTIYLDGRMEIENDLVRTSIALRERVHWVQLAQLDALVDAVTEGREGAYERGRAVVASLFELTEQDPLSMRFILNAKHRECLPDAPPICSAKPFVKVRDVVNQGILDGEVRAMDPWAAAACTFGPALRMITLRLDDVLPSSLDGTANPF